MAASEDSGRRRSSRRRKGKHKHASQMEIDLSDIQLPPESIPLPPEPIPPPPPPLPPPSQPPPLPTGLANNGEMEAPPPPPPPPPPKDEHHSGREPILMKIKKISPTPMSKDGSGEHRGDKTKPGSPGKIRFQIKPVVRRVSYGDDTTSSEHGTGHSEVKQPIRFKMKRRDGKFQAEDLSRIVHEEMDHQVSESETTKDSSNVISEVNTGVTPLSSSTSVNKKEIRLPIIGRITRSRADDRSKSETGKSKVTFSVQNMIRQKMKALSHGNRDLPEPQVVLDKLDPSDLETVKLYDQLTQEKMAHNAPATSTKLPGVETLTSTDIGMSGPDVIPKVETRLPGPIPALVQPDSPSVPELHGQKQEKIQIGDKPDRVETIERKHEPGLPPKTIITRTVVVDHSQRSLGNKPRLRRSRFDVVSSDHNRTSETSDAGTKTHKDKPLSISQDSTHTGETETNRSKRSHRESPSRIEIDLPIPSFGIQALETDLHKTKKPEQSCKDSSSDNLRHIVKEKFVPIGKDVSSIQPPAPLAIPVPPPVPEQTKVDMFDVPLPVCDPTTATIPLPRDSHQDTAHKVEEPVTDNAIEIAEPSTPVLDEPRDVTDISFTVPITESSISDAPFENKEIPVVKLVNYEAADDVVRGQEPVDMDIDDSNEAKEANIEETKVIDEEAETAVNSILEQNYEKCEENYEETQKLDFAWDNKKQGHENLSQSECQEEQVPVEKKGWCENTEAKEVWQTESQDEWSQSWGETASKKEPVDMKEGPADDEGVESDQWSASQQWLQDVQVSERAEWTPVSRQPNSEHSESVKPEVLANTAHRTDSDESLGVKLCPEIVQPEEQISMIPIPISEEAGESNWKSLAQNASVASEEASTMPEPCAGSREESQNMQVSQNHEHDQMDVPVGAIPMPNDDRDDKETNITKSFSQNTMLNMEANVIHTLDSDDKGESQWIKSASQIVEPDMPATMIPGPTDDDTKEVQTMKLHSPSLTSGLLSDRFSQPIGENSETLQEIEPFCSSIKPDIQADNVTESLSDSVSDSEESENLKYFHQSGKTELAVPAVKMSRSISSDSSESEESQNVKSSTDNITDQNTDTLNTGLFDDTPIVMEPSDPSDIDGTVKSDDEDVRARMELEYLNFEQAIGLEPARENKLEEIEGTLPNQEYDGGPTCHSREMVEQEENEHKQTESELDINESNDAQVEDEKNETEEPWSSAESGVDGTTHDEGSLQGVPADQEESSQYEGRLLVGQSPTRQTEEQRSEKLVNYPVSEESRLSPSDNSQDETPDLSPQQFPEPELEQEEESAKDLQANEVFHHDLSTDITTEQNKQESQSQSCEDVYEARLSSHKAESDLVSHEDSERFNVELQHAKDEEEAYSPSSAMDIEEDESTDKDIPASVSGPETEPMQGGQHPDPESSLEEDDNRGLSSKDQAECWGGGQESEGVGNRAEGPGLDSAPEVSADSYDIPKDDHATNVQGSEQLDSQEFKGADEAPKSVDEYIEQGAPEHSPDDTTAVYRETESPVRDIDTGQETGVAPEIPGELHEKQSEMDLELSSSRDSSEAGKPDSGSDTRADDSCGSGKGRKRRPSRRSLQGLGLDQADTESADAESECASTRRRSRRIKSIEERREREKEEKETKGRGEKVRGNKEERQLRHQEDRERRDREERERKRQEEKDKREADRKTRRERQEKLRQEKGQIKIKLETTSIFHEDAKASEIPVDVTSIPVPDSPIPTSTSAVGGSLLSPSSASENKDLLRRPEIDALRREDFGSPKHEKVKSRWRRWSEAEAVAGQAGQAGLSPVQSSSASTSPVVAKPEPSYPIKQELLFAPPPPPPPPPPPLPPAPVVVSESVATAPLETTAKPEVDPQLVSPKVDSKPLAAIEEAPNEESPSMEIDYHEFISKMEEEMGAETSVLVENESLESEGILPTEPEALPPEMPKAKEPEVEEGETAPDESTPYFEKISDNIYLSERKKSKAKKEVKRMLCDCTTSREDRAMGIPACGEDCLNRLLMIECGSRCPCADYCTNRRFQRHDYCKTETFKTSHKGWGLQAKENLERDTFVMEYVGEVLDFDKFKARTEEYDRHNQTHYYFMALNSDEIIDATKRGNESRFINHSCNPNCETQKWTVNGELRIGFFTKRDIKKEEELTFDYQFESYGESQKCYCGSSNCRGVLGGEKTTLFRYGATASTTTSTKAPATPVRANKKKPKKENFDDRHLQDDIDKMTQLDGMRNRRHVLELARLMVRAESSEHRTALLKIMQVTSEQACLRLFLDYHGLSLMWSWMADIGEGSLDLKMQHKLLARLSSHFPDIRPSLNKKLRSGLNYAGETFMPLGMALVCNVPWVGLYKILKTLKSLPINNKTILQDSKVMNVVQKWAKQIAEAAEKDTETETASDTPSQSGTPLRSETPSQVETPTCSETPSQSDTPTVAGPEGPSVKNLEITSDAFQKMPHKKRRLLQHALEDSSSDSELSESSRLSMIPGIVPLEPVQNVASDNSMQGMAVDPELPSNKKSDTDSEIGALSVSEISLPPSDSIKAELKDEGMELEPGEIADTELEEGEIKEKSALKAEILSESSRDGTETPAPETPKPVEDNKSQKIADMASQLLDTWKDLKEMFKIPKRVVEERKRTERELDRRYRERDHRDRDYDRHRERGRSHDRHYDRDYDRYRDRDRERDRERERDRDRDRERDRNRDRDRYDRKRHREESPERRDRHDRRSEKKHRRSEDRDDDSRDKKDKDGKKEKEDEGPLKTRKVLLPTPPKISKHERRKLFEAEVKAKEEMEELQKAYMLQQQLQQSTDPAYQFYQDPNMAQFGDPSGAQFVDPNSAQFVDPNAAQFVDPNAAQFVDPNSAFADPNAQFTDPNAVQYADPNVPAYTDPVATPYLDSAGGQFAEPTGQYGEPMTPAPLLPDHTPGQVAAQQMVMNADGTMTAATPANKIPSLLSVDPSQPPQTVVSAPAQTPIIPQQQQQFVETSAPPVVYQTQQGFQVQQSFVQAQPQTVAAPTAPPRQPLQNYMPGTTTQIVQNVQGQLQTVQRIPVVQGQQVYYTTPQGVVVQQQTYPQGAVQQGAVTQASVATPSPQVIQVMKPSQTLSPGQLAQVQQLQQQLQIQQQQLAQLAPAAAHDDPPPPPSPPKSKSQKLPPNWKTARDAEGKTYYYHSVTRQTQWDPPTWDSGDQDDMDLGTPTHDEPSSKKKKTLTAAADTSSELAKRMKDQFKYNMSQFMKICLNPYRKPDCKIGRITSTEDFKHLARKLTHTILDKELKQCRHHLEDLEVNENVKAKAKDYVKKYMSRFGSTYKKVQSP